MKSRQRQQPTTAGLTPKIAEDIVEMMGYVLTDDSSDREVRMQHIFSKLSENDRYILCVYAELQSYRKMADVLGASATTWRREIARIRKYFAKI